MAVRASAQADLRMGKLKAENFYSDVDNAVYLFTGRVEGNNYFFRRTESDGDESRVLGTVTAEELDMLTPVSSVKRRDGKVIVAIGPHATKQWELSPNFRRVA
jgi:hypothetical protein